MADSSGPDLKVAAPPKAIASPPAFRPIHLLLALRPAQFTKNLIVFAALIFAQELFVPAAAMRATVAFGIFCAISGVVYLVNDLVDREQDGLHPEKRLRPIASGAMPASVAVGEAVVLAVGALTVSFALSLGFGLVATAYLALLVGYSFALKHIVILDVLAIAIGFVLRAVAGGIVIDVPVSQWLLACTILLALFLALAKRRHELVLLNEAAVAHRPILGEYSRYLLDQMISVVTASTIMSYILYAISEDTAARLGTDWLSLTIPFPLYGVFRYLYLTHRKGGGQPSELLLRDLPLLTCVGLWGAVVVVIIYL